MSRKPTPVVPTTTEKREAVICGTTRKSRAPNFEPKLRSADEPASKLTRNIESTARLSSICSDFCFLLCWNSRLEGAFGSWRKSIGASVQRMAEPAGPSLGRIWTQQPRRLTRVLYAEQMSRPRREAGNRSGGAPGERRGAAVVLVPGRVGALRGLPRRGVRARHADGLGAHVRTTLHPDYGPDDSAESECWQTEVDEAFAYRESVLSEVATLAAEQGACVAFAGDAALMANGLGRLVTTRKVAILSRPALRQPPQGVVIYDVGQTSDVRLYWSALARAGKVPTFPIPIVRKEHLAALAMVERDWEAFDELVGSMVPFRRRTVRRVILRDIGSHAARMFDDAVTKSVGADWHGRGQRTRQP